MKKYVVAISVVFLLVVFPIASLWYLNSGYKFRKQALTELQAKQKITGELVDKLSLNEQTTLIHNYDTGSKETINKIKLIRDQYGEDSGFQIISVIDQNKLINLSDSIDWKIIPLSGKESFSNVLLESNFTLIDTGANVRNQYTLADSSFRKMVEHIAIVIPRKKDPDIELRRQNEK